MSGSSRSTSPDPLTLPSSPLAAHSIRRSSVKPLALRTPPHARPSPSKSLVMETGTASDASPWRIRVTVEAEPQAGSPTTHVNGKPTMVPLKGAGSVSPAKKRGSTGEENAPALSRKRKGTPIRRKRAVKASREPPKAAEESDGAGMPAPSSPTRKKRTAPAAAGRRRKSLQTLPKQRGPRLSQAREELNQALSDAIGYCDDSGYDGDGVGGVASHMTRDAYAPGDMTIMNEDFTMVSVDTLQSMKGETSLLSNHHDGAKSTLTLSYLPSSPPSTAAPTASEAQQDMREAGMTPAQTYEAMSWKLTGAARVEEGQRVTSPRHTSACSNAPLWNVQESAQAEHPDMMSWRATGIARNETSLRAEQQMMEHRMRKSQSVPEPACNQSVQADNSQAVVTHNDNAGVEGTTVANEHSNEDDIWQEEASRSLEESSELARARSRRNRAPKASQHPAAPTAEHMHLFDNQPIKPPRAKIPRTWRRSSGVHFSYSDSPDHEQPLDVSQRRDRSTDEGGSRASSGVLTPPSSDDEARNADVQLREDDGMSLTQPDAAATQLQHSPAEHEFVRASAEDVRSPSSGSRSPATSADSDDTGLFWMKNMPQIYSKQRERERPGQQRQRAVDLSDLLYRSKSGSPAVAVVPARANNILAAGQSEQSTCQISTATSTGVAMPRMDRPLSPHPVDGRHQTGCEDTVTEKIGGPPLRKMFLRSSRALGSPKNKSTKELCPARPKLLNYAQTQDYVHGEETLPDESEFGFDSFESAACDQRQLLGELASARIPLPPAKHPIVDRHADGPPVLPVHRLEVIQDGGDDEKQNEEDSIEEKDDVGEQYEEEEPSRSYEEQLNLDSPQKVKVNFNDSEGHSSLLAPRKQYAPLFGNQAPEIFQEHSNPNATLVSRTSSNPAIQAPPGVFSRLAANFWSVVVRPSGPTEILPTPRAQEPTFPSALRAHIRSRYGVVRTTHPWTMSHMRTLHRMLNSCTSSKLDSIIPNEGRLPTYLIALINVTRTSFTGYRFTFTQQHAYVTWSFMQVLVPDQLIDAMKKGEVAMLGDETARLYRGEMGHARRRGDDLVWPDRREQVPMDGDITWEWVVRCLGDVVCANVQTAEREAGMAALRALGES